MGATHSLGVSVKKKQASPIAYMTTQMTTNMLASKSMNDKNLGMYYRNKELLE